MLKRFRDLLERLPEANLEPIEIREAILNEIEENLVKPVGDGRRRLCNRIRITLLSPVADKRNLLRRNLSAGTGLKDRIVSRCAALNVEVPDSLIVSIEDGIDLDSQNALGFRIEGSTEDPPRQPAARAKTPCLVMLATGETIQISSNIFRIGRERQPKDRSGRPKPENQLHFGENETTVSRQHAAIRFDESTGAYRLWDVGSTQGTRIVREDGEIDVARSSRAPGERLRHDDLIYFGKVGVQFQLVSASRKARKGAATTSSMPTAGEQTD